MYMLYRNGWQTTVRLYWEKIEWSLEKKNRILDLICDFHPTWPPAWVSSFSNGGRLCGLYWMDHYITCSLHHVIITWLLYHDNISITWFVHHVNYHVIITSRDYFITWSSNHVMFNDRRDGMCIESHNGSMKKNVPEKTTDSFKRRY